MKLASFQRICIILVAILLLAVISSGVGLFSAWRSAASFRRLGRQNLEQARAIYEVQTALLEQGLSTSLYLMDGKAEWLDQLRRKKPDFQVWLERARRMGLNQEEQEVIDQIGRAFEKYESRSKEAIALYAAKDIAAARKLWLEETIVHYDGVYQLCESLSRANTQDIVQAFAAQAFQTKRMNLWGLVFLCVLAGLILGLALSLSYGVFRPLRHLVDSLGSEPAARGPTTSSRREIQLLESYIGRLREEIVQVSSHLSLSEGRLLDAEKLASVGKLAAGVAHEIRSPLTALRLRVYSMQRVLGDARSQADLQLISEEITRLDGIVRDFLEFAKPRQLALQSCQVPLLLDKTLELLAHKLAATGVTVERDEEPGLPAVQADPQQLKQVFVNVLNNAIEALPEGGVIRIAVRRAEPVEGQRTVRIVVSDNGPGILPELRDSIFEPFFGTKAEGTGLGLWVARRILSEHGGGIELEPAGPTGTAFSLWLPVNGDSGNEPNPRS
jgi:signal transduction histidine kinase